MQSYSFPAQFVKILAIDPFVVQPSEYILKIETCQIGRAVDCQIVVNHKRVSRYHARIERKGEGYLLYDNNSTNGTYINESRISEPHLLKNDDVIGLGEAEALLRFNDPDPTEQILSSLLRYDKRTLKFYLGNDPLDLPPTQFRLLYYLYFNAGQVCTRENCAEAIWGSDYDPGLAADAFDKIIFKLRKALRKSFRQIDSTIRNEELIETIRGRGYKLNL